MMSIAPALIAVSFMLNSLASKLKTYLLQNYKYYTPDERNKATTNAGNIFTCF